MGTKLKLAPLLAHIAREYPIGQLLMPTHSRRGQSEERPGIAASVHASAFAPASASISAPFPAKTKVQRQRRSRRNAAVVENSASHTAEYRQRNDIVVDNMDEKIFTDPEAREILALLKNEVLELLRKRSRASEEQ
ncbi:hypothetical protein BX666DRAFT_2023680 [Dichotomocladium elegans]|nr:hypothetical protein BX666DRAFT_2023680 [Dichotomocladium elegans]